MHERVRARIDANVSCFRTMYVAGQNVKIPPPPFRFSFLAPSLWFVGERYYGDCGRKIRSELEGLLLFLLALALKGERWKVEGGRSCYWES